MAVIRLPAGEEGAVSDERVIPLQKDNQRRFDPVPTPLRVRWREFRYGFLPVVMFGGALATTFWLWQHTGTSTGIAGIGEGARSMVVSPFPATVQRVLVEPYEMVSAGDPVAIIVPVDPGAEVDRLRTEFDLARLQLQPSIAEENAMNFEQIRIDLLNTRADLEIAKVNLQLAVNQVKRNAPLFAEKLISEDVYDISVQTRDMFAAEVRERSNAVLQIEKRIEELGVLGVPQTGNTNSFAMATLARLQALQANIATNWAPLTLRAPISGMVAAVNRHPGEHAVEGEPLIGINSPVSERVVGYLRQPYPVEPSIGMEVVMTTRERKPKRIPGVVTRIGAQVEMITNALAFVRQGSLVDVGLPIVIGLPTGVPVRPGEIVDLSFRSVRSAEGAVARKPEDIRAPLARGTEGTVK